jgi:hypothetical protein
MPGRNSKFPIRHAFHFVSDKSFLVLFFKKELLSCWLFQSSSGGTNDFGASIKSCADIFVLIGVNARERFFRQGLNAEFREWFALCSATSAMSMGVTISLAYGCLARVQPHKRFDLNRTRSSWRRSYAREYPPGV